jgi:hypothetical protein
MKYTNNKNNISEILKVYIINSITKSYILNIKIRPLVTKYALTNKLVGGTDCCFMPSEQLFSCIMARITLER